MLGEGGGVAKKNFFFGVGVGMLGGGGSRSK